VDFKSEYNNWNTVDPAILFTASLQKQETTPKMRIVAMLEQESKHCDYLILWLDCDKEGENICFEVMQICRFLDLPKRNRVLRAKFSAITADEIRKAMQHLGVPNEDEAKSVDARQELDLKIGCAFTRFQTRYFNEKYGNLDSNVISYGPCQIPTLAFCVERHDKIVGFTAESFWTLLVRIDLTSRQAGIQNLDWCRGHVFDKEVAVTFEKLTRASSQAQIISVKHERKEKQRPSALNTVELLKIASNQLGYSPHYTMQLAERLYTQGYISYPRTETSAYPSGFDLVGTLRNQLNHPLWGDHAHHLMEAGIRRPTGGIDVGDHPPITPSRMAIESDLGHDAWRLYEYIVRHFLGSISSNCKYQTVTYRFRVGQEEFFCHGRTSETPGFTLIMPWLGVTDDVLPHDMKEGERFSVTEVTLKEGKTSPPDYLTESELIDKMERHGIGTDASIPVHIQTICERNYVQVKMPGRHMVPTNLGIILIHGYQRIDPDLCLPTLRSEVEKQLNLIACGKVDMSSVLDYAVDIFSRKYEYFTKMVGRMDELFEATFSSVSASGKPFSRCGTCHRYMKYIPTK
jgi:DNA topoisomerase III